MLVFLLATLCTAAAGVTLHVPSVYSTIQDAIDASANGDQIEVAPGTYNEAIDFNGKAVHLYSRDGAASTTIDGGGGVGTLVVQCRSGEGADTILEGFTITGGNGQNYGGGMYNSNNSSPTVTNCTFTGNSSTWGGAGMINWKSSPSVTGCTFSGNSGKWGGGMFNRENSPTVTDCTFTGNYAGSSGGGIYNWTNSSPTVTNCTFTGNVAGGGGGMYNIKDSSPTVTGCTFSGNSTTVFGGGMHNTQNSNPEVTNCTFIGNSSGDGGGMLNWNSSSPTLTNCTFTGNVADRGGGMYNHGDSSPSVTNCTFSNNSSGSSGGMYNSNSNPEVTNCTFSGNSATRSSGGMHNRNNSSPTVTNCTFTGNSVGGSGGGMRNTQNSNPEVTNCTFTGNSAGDRGGGMHNSDSNPIFIGCTFSGNSAGSGGGMRNDSSSSTVTNCILWGDTPDEITGGTPAITYSDVQGGTGQPWFGAGCIDADPFFADPDGRLLAGSPCIDAGDNSAVMVSTDLDGNPRIVGLAVDMGAYEFQEPTQHAAAKTEQLIDEVVVLNLQQGIENSLDSKLDAVSKALDDVNQNNDIAAINALQAFINAIEAQRGKKITNEQADELIAAAQEIIDLLMAD